MTKQEAQDMLKQVQEKLALQGHVVNDRLLHKEAELKAYINGYDNTHKGQNMTYTPREAELMNKQDNGSITMDELLELRDIKRANIAHLQIKSV